MDITRTQSAAMVAVLQTAQRYAETSHPVLIMGETGVGKTELATYIHATSDRAGKAWVEVNCGGLADSIIDSQLFGHERGAFTGAVSAHPGFFEQADGGTIFLDEIGELPLEAQRRLLIVLQSGRVQRMGSARVRTVDVRVIAATNRDLAAEVKAKRFREDLYFRLCTLDLHMPPLRERREDIPLLLDCVCGLSEGARAAFVASSYAWPGNVRELLNAALKAAVLRWGAADVASNYAPAPRPSQDIARDEVVLDLAARRGSVSSEAVMGALGCRRDTARQILVRLRRRGQLTRAGRGLYIVTDRDSHDVSQSRHHWQSAAPITLGPCPCDAVAEPASPEPYDASLADPDSFLGRRGGGLWERAVAGYFFAGGCPRCGCPDCEPDADGWLTCELDEQSAEGVSP
jgi:DNA-binding NtrC family response regulator